jgi:hypothetical protein
MERQLKRKCSANLMHSNSFNMSPVKLFSHVQSQDTKALKLSHLINITHCPFHTSPHNKIFHLRSNISDNENFFTHFIHCLYQNLKQFPRVSIHSVSKTQHSNGLVCSCTLISKVISAMQPHGRCGGVVFLPRCRDCSHSPLLGLCHDNQKIVSGSWKPILAVP